MKKIMNFKKVMNIVVATMLFATSLVVYGKDVHACDKVCNDTPTIYKNIECVEISIPAKVKIIQDENAVDSVLFDIKTPNIMLRNSLRYRVDDDSVMHIWIDDPNLANDITNNEVLVTVVSSNKVNVKPVGHELTIADITYNGKNMTTGSYDENN